LRVILFSQFPIAKGEILANKDRDEKNGAELTVHLCDIKRNIYIPVEELDGTVLESSHIKAELEVINASFRQGGMAK
jgi:hypothetical protein